MASSSLKVAPLTRNFSLDSYKSFKVEPHIGTEFERGTLQIRDILKAENSEELLHDLAVLVSERNVVFLRNQDITFEEQKELADRLGRAGKKPSTSGLHSHPIFDEAVFGEKRFPVSSDFYKQFPPRDGATEFHSKNWHGSATYERVAPDYAVTRIRQVPPEGGDTLYASAYELLEGLTATHSGEGYIQLEKAGIIKINPGPRGAPEDVDTTLVSVHPVIRTNPVTGWKGVYVNKLYTKRINELSKDESDLLLNHLFELTTQNHDLQVRSEWHENDVAIWDERSTFYTDTLDFEFETFSRVGDRVLSLGEVPYFDEASKSRRDAIGVEPPPAAKPSVENVAVTEKSPATPPTTGPWIKTTTTTTTTSVKDGITIRRTVSRSVFSPQQQA
ncbi:hypothetical protein BDR26DRAFT_908965 [Obelidium mucronatum]|nr:hypothetical protein BDR26DRAFT_908965 [Obelidium mucronatum]